MPSPCTYGLQQDLVECMIRLPNTRYHELSSLASALATVHMLAVVHCALAYCACIARRLCLAYVRACCSICPCVLRAHRSLSASRMRSRLLQLLHDKGVDEHARKVCAKALLITGKVFIATASTGADGGAPIDTAATAAH